MNTENICFDTNSLISYLFFVEPNYKIMRSFFRKSDANFYFTKHVLDECDNVINRKIQIINAYTQI